MCVSISLVPDHSSENFVIGDVSSEINDERLPVQIRFNFTVSHFSGMFSKLQRSETEKLGMKVLKKC